MKTLIVSALLIICGQVLADIYLLPTQPTNRQIQALFEQELGQHLLFHRPVELPVEVERTHKAMIVTMTPWVKLGFVSQEDTRFMAEKMMYGEPREVSVGGFKYTYDQENPLVTEKGIYYGRPKLKQIFSVSQVREIGGEYFCEVYISWYADDIQSWINKVNLRLRENRLLRRAKESFDKPFEKRLQLVKKDDEWQLWQGNGSKRVKQTLF